MSIFQEHIINKSRTVSKVSNQAHNKRKIMPNPQFIGIMGYLIGLEKIHNPGKSLRQLRILLDKMNTSFADGIKIKFTIMKEMGFKGAVNRTFPLQNFLALYYEEFGKNIGTHFGIGLGKLGFEREKMPGGCFFSATKAMVEAKEKGEFLIFHQFEMNKALNALFYFIHEMNEHMTDRQQQVVEEYRKCGDIVSVADRLYLSKQAVHDSIKSSNYSVYSAAWSGLQELLAFNVRRGSTVTSKNPTKIKKSGRSFKSKKRQKLTD